MAVTAKNSSKLQKSLAMVIVACIAILFFSSFDKIQSKSRDAKRLSDAQEVLRAMELYFDRHGSYPTTDDLDYGGFDTSIEPRGQAPDFMSVLVQDKILSQYPQDPINDEYYYYRYQKFPRGSFGCNRPFVIFQIFNFETPQDSHGGGACPDRNFADEAPNGFTIMKFE